MRPLVAATASEPQAPAVVAAHAVIRNAVFLLLAYLLPRLLTFGSVVIAARVLEVSAFGAYSTAAAYAVILSVVSTLGLMPLLIRDIARSPERAPALLRSAHWIKTGANALMLGTLVGLGWGVLHFPPSVLAAALLLGLSYAVGAYAENLAAYFQAVERMQVWMQASALAGVVGGGLGAALVVLTSSLLWFCVAPVVGQLASLAWLLVRAPAEVRRGAAAQRREVLALTRSLLPFAAAAVALTLYYKIDVLLLAFWRSAAEVGIYSAAYKFVDIWQALVIVAVGAAYPRLSRLQSRADGGAPWAGTRLTELVVLAAIPAAATIWLARALIVHGLFGVAYGEAVPVLAWLAPVLPALAINVLSGYLLASRGRMSHAAGLYVAGLALNVGLNAVLIPALGAQGVALAMLVSEVLLACGFLILLRAHAAFPGVRALAAAGGALVLWGGCALLPGRFSAIVVVLLYLAGVFLLYRQAKVIAGSERRVLRLALHPSGGIRVPDPPVS